MKTAIDYQGNQYKIDLAKPLDISIPLRGSKENINAWYLPEPTINPVIDGDFIGKVSEGAAVNFNTITFNPHAHGTHTECIGHITNEFYSINTLLKQFFFYTEVISITPQKKEKDLVFTKEQLIASITTNPQALVIRTLPNTEEKLTKQYSHTNWPYLTADAAEHLANIGINHLLIDQPSVDKEKDEGRLAAHKAFWQYPKATKYEATITEMIFVPDTIKDGIYFLNLQIAPIENDATPSKPILYQLH